MAQVGERTATGSLRAAFEREHRQIDDVVLAATDTAGDRYDGRQLSAALHTLRRHIYAEEELMFPALRDAGLVGPVLVMLREHGEMWALLDTIDELVGADDGGEAVAAACASLFDLLRRHNPKEEAMLYPQVDALLDAESASVLRQLLLAGDLPAGWRCQHQR